MQPSRKNKLAPIDFQALKAEVSLLEELRGPCPVHGSSSATSTIFAVSPTKNAWKCHKCEAGGNQLDLAASYFNLPQDQVVRIAVALCRELGREIPRHQ
jgi:hypothetical protein